MDIDDHTSGQIVCGLEVTCVLVNLPSTHEQPRGGRSFRMPTHVGPIQLSQRLNSINVPSIIDAALFKFVQLVLLDSLRQCILTELGTMTLSVPDARRSLQYLFFAGQSCNVIRNLFSAGPIF